MVAGAFRRSPTIRRAPSRVSRFDCQRPVIGVRLSEMGKRLDHQGRSRPSASPSSFGSDRQ